MSQPASPNQADSSQASGFIGAVLSKKWRILHLVGEGGMGLVFTGENVHDGRRVAIKILRSEFVSDPMIQARFVEEAAACMRLHHVNVLRVFETAQAEDGTPYIVMELLDGVPLSAYTRQGDRVPVPLAVSIMHGVLRGLGAAHAAAIVHRDLKPENIFLARDASGQFTVKLLDFGIAKVMDVAGGMGNKTKTGMLLGTPAYMSPEQVKSSKDADTRSDLWAAGVLFYELLAGVQAFRAGTEFARLTLILSAAPDPLASFNPSLASWQPFVDRALEKDRERRFQTAAEMEQALGQVASGSPMTANAARAPMVSAPAPPMANAYASTTPSMQAPPMLSSFESTAPSIGGTLSSPRGLQPSRPPEPQVHIVTPGSGDGESLSFRGKSSSGISRLVVALLVLFALIAGFAMGFAAARSSG